MQHILSACLLLICIMPVQNLQSLFLQGPDKNTLCGRRLLVLPFALKTLICALILDEDIHRTNLSLLPNPFSV